MGTNFYINDIHIGKRSAAGLWCWSCGETLVEGGISMVHTGLSGFLDACPRCHRMPTEKDADISGCCSFTWAMTQAQLYDSSWKQKGKIIKDEYHKQYTFKQFLSLLDECPIQYFGSVGKEFS